MSFFSETVLKTIHEDSWQIVDTGMAKYCDIDLRVISWRSA